MEADLVKFSRAGDVFHYRWAARRCLRLLDLNTKLTSIVIEGSKERSRAGEYVIDVAEYSQEAPSSPESVTYYQLKHSTKNKHIPFNLSDLKGTIEGFSQRFMDTVGDPDIANFNFVIITNRQFNPLVKDCVQAICDGTKSDTRTTNTLKKYTSLSNAKLREFCQKLTISDGEGDYRDQKDVLQYELSCLMAGGADVQQVDSLSVLVQERAATARTDGIIYKEHVLQKFGLMEADLYPAPPKFEDNPGEFILREQHADLRTSVLQSQTPVIIHADGGVGKTVVAQQLASDLPQGSFGLVYDCFGAGNYRNRSTFRHSHETALVQIINELSVEGLCQPIIPASHNLNPQKLMRTFLLRVGEAVASLRKKTPGASLVILIDAADNAEMAAAEFNQDCFANELLRENMPDGCRLVALCRSGPDRMGLLRPNSTVQKIELNPFSENETLQFLRATHPNATKSEALEFHRLSSNGNPRVQSYALSDQEKDIRTVLESLGPNPTSVNDQIEAQLESAIEKIREELPSTQKEQIDAICLGLANLPPLIPLDILSKASGVGPEVIRSFVSDLRRPLWISENSVQFRDEPTEHWFRNSFSATAEQISTFVNRLKPLAAKSTYIAETLPALLLQAEKYDDLVHLALSDEFLPQNNPVDERNVRNYRLQFAFKAALKSNKFVDASKIAFRAGEEEAGNTRQQDLLNNNVDLVSRLFEPGKIQELALRREFSGSWEGSENLYSSALLSSVPDFKGEAQSYFRSGARWLRIYFDADEGDQRNGRLEDEDVVEYTTAIFNLFGPEKAAESLLRWTPRSFIFHYGRKFVRRLVDQGDLTSIDTMAEYGNRNPYLILAITNELSSVGRFPKAETLTNCLALLINKKSRISKSHSLNHEADTTHAILSFAEACANYGVSTQKILRLLRHYIPQQASQWIGGDHHGAERGLLFRGTALREALQKKTELSANDLWPKSEENKNNKYDRDQDYLKFEEAFKLLYPWHLTRARAICGEQINLDEDFQSNLVSSRAMLGRRYKEYDPLKTEIPSAQFQAIVHCKHASTESVKAVVSELIKPDTAPGIWLKRTNATRIAYRQDHLSCVQQNIEKEDRESIVPQSDVHPETIADEYIALARAVLCKSKDDAAVYFDKAVEIASKFGDEVIARWNAVEGMAEKSSELDDLDPKLVYRFARCGEVISAFYDDHVNLNVILEHSTKMNTSSAFSILSRWIDRDVGLTNELISSVVETAVHENKVPPNGGWSCTAFLSGSLLVSLTKTCCEYEPDESTLQNYIDQTTKDLTHKGAVGSIWPELNETAGKYGCFNDTLTENVAAESQKEKQSSSNALKKQVEFNWGDIFQDYDLCTASGLKAARRNYLDRENYSLGESFWNKALERIEPNHANAFLGMVIDNQDIHFFETHDLFQAIPAEWRLKVSFGKSWHRFLENLGEKFYREFSNPYYTRQYYRDALKEDPEKAAIQKGVIKGFTKSKHLFSASDFFQFSLTASQIVTSNEALQLLDYALSRFENHIEDDKADGEWENWLTPPSDPLSAFTGFIWTMLGSPHAAYRWDAAHCVRRLMVSGCRPVISKLVEFLKDPRPPAFVGKGHPFYDLHAKQYLLIAFSRGSKEAPETLKDFFDVFEEIALKGKPHLLFQKYSADVAVNLSQAFPEICDVTVVDQLMDVIAPKVAPLAVKERYRAQFDSPWHKAGKSFPTDKLYLGMDIGDRWLSPLGNVFCIPHDQIEDIVKDILVNQWKIPLEDKYLRDPRQDIWNSRRYAFSMDYRDGTIPKTDNYSFYLSYHALMTIAPELAATMPVIQYEEERHDEWMEWVNRHIAVFQDGSWRSDRRDAVPRAPIEWDEKEKDADWCWEILSESFLSGLLTSHDEETWLNIDGYWRLTDGQYAEQFWIESMLVSPETADSLINTLNYGREINDRYLPRGDEHWDVDIAPQFKLTQWAVSRSDSDYLDDWDPHSGGITTSPRIIKKSVVERMGLRETTDQREWYLPDTSTPVVLSELWSEGVGYDKEAPYRNGNRLKASFDFLRALCEEFERHLIISVKIHREKPKSYSQDDIETNHYMWPYLNFYILSPDGTIRDAKRHHSVR